MNGKTRTYWLYVPKDCPENAPLVVAMHGAGGSSQDQSPHFNEIADKEKFMVAYPQGLPINFAVFGGNVNGWNASGQENDDVNFIRALVEDANQHHTIDRNRVYACGFSNGGMNAYALANTCSDVFAACASISGFPLNEFHLRHTNERPVPFLHIHGKKDDFVKYSLMPVIVDEMVARLGANPIPVKSGVSGKYDKSVYEAADGSFPYIYYEIDDMGHNDFTVNTEDGNSSLTMWNFFKQYTLDMPYDQNLRWSPRIETEGFNPQEHGWANRARTTLTSFGDTKTDDDQNVYHALQLAQGTYKLSFNSVGDADKTVTVKIRRMPSTTLIFESTANTNEAVEMVFKTESKWSEYKILFTCSKKNDVITVKDIRIDACPDEEANGIVSIANGQQPTANGIYDLQGRKISVSSVLPKGIYIKNGKKVVY